MKRFRFVYMCECYLDADTEEEAMKNFMDLTDNELREKSDFIDVAGIKTTCGNVKKPLLKIKKWQ